MAREDTRPPELSPSDDAVGEVALRCSRAAKVDTRRLDRFMSHQVGKVRDVVELRKEVLGLRSYMRYMQLLTHAPNKDGSFHFGCGKTAFIV